MKNELVSLRQITNPELGNYDITKWGWESAYTEPTTGEPVYILRSMGNGSRHLANLQVGETSAKALVGRKTLHFDNLDFRTITAQVVAKIWEVYPRAVYTVPDEINMLAGLYSDKEVDADWDYSDLADRVIEFRR